MRVCAYCRVSTDKEDQLNSLQNQRDFFESYIQQHEGWSLVQIFADEGISGTSTKNRAAFNEMIKKCKNGSIDLILTKEVSRFARNTVDTLEYTRLLKRHEVGVLFINDNIDTRQNDGEFRLSIMASVAQEESRKTSERVKWGQKRSMERGVVFGNNTLFGFTTKDGTLSVNQEQAEIVRLIYSKFINEGKGTHIIARELYEEGIAPPKTATEKWSSTMILRILRNEKYVGDLLQKKEVTVDYLTHKKVVNRGIEDKIYIRDHHEAIIDRDTWNRTQNELNKRKNKLDVKSKHSNRYWCSGKIKCGYCGSRFVIRRGRKNKEYKAWACHNRVQYGNWKRDDQGRAIGCNMHMINDKSLTECVKHVLMQLNLEADSIANSIVSDLKKLLWSVEGENKVSKEYKRKEELEAKKVKVLDAYFSKTITRDEMQKMKDLYNERITRIDQNIERISKFDQISRVQKNDISQLRSLIKDCIFNSKNVYKELIEEVIVYQDFLVIRVKIPSISFRVQYSTHGYKDNYTTVIESSDVITGEDKQ